MSFNAEISNARSEIQSVQADCLTLVQNAEKALLDASAANQDTLRLMMVPILYSAWERLFTLTNAIRIKLLQKCNPPCSSYPPIQRVAWMLKEPFFQSFRDKCVQSEINHKTVEEFLTESDKWLSGSFNSSLNPEELPLLKSNVNKKVVELNARLFGLDHESQFKKLDFSRLDDLVGRRNKIGHGAIITPPGEKELIELTIFVKELLRGYSDLIIFSLRKLKKR